MNKVRKKFVLYAEIAVFILLTVLLSVINVINFTMVTEDADRITETISHYRVKFFREPPEETSNTQNNNGEHTGIRKAFGVMGVNSPEMNASLRYFTYAFDKDGNAEKIEHRMTAVTEEEAVEWARSLLKEDTGWTNTIYRYRVYEKDDKKIYVTVIDEGRELLPSYRILFISAVGEVLVLLISYLVLVRVGKSLFKQFEEADRKQKLFIASVEQDFKMPLTVINANTEIIERQNGTNEQTQAINRQVRKMTELVKNLGALSIFEETDVSLSNIDLSNMFNIIIDSEKSKFEEKNISLEFAVEPDIYLKGDEQAIRKSILELTQNSVNYSLTKAKFTLKKQGDRIIILQTNDTSLPDGSIDQIFDRFTTLENAKDKNTVGLGLSYVKDIVKAHNGRVSANVKDNIFTLEIAL